MTSPAQERAFADDTPEIRERLNDHLEDVLSRFWPGWVRSGKVAYPEPASKEDRGSFQVYLANHGKHQRGRWFRNSAGIGGDEINLFAYGLTGRHKADAEVFAKARQFVGLAAPTEATEEDRRRSERLKQQGDQRRAQHEREAAQYEEDTLEAATAIWNASRPIKGTLAETYLASRGFTDLPDTLPLRFHPALKYPGKGKMPALVCRVDDFAGDITGIWRVYLAADGSGKAALECPRLGLGPCGGGAVRLGNAGEKVGLAEGLESALGAWCLTSRRYPAWAVLSTSGMTGIELPLSVKHVVVFPDGDHGMRRKNGEYVPITIPPGRKAAQTLRARLATERVACTIAAEPNPGLDYNDIWLRSRDEAAA